MFLTRRKNKLFFNIKGNFIPLILFLTILSPNVYAADKINLLQVLINLDSFFGVLGILFTIGFRVVGACFLAYGFYSFIRVANGRARPVSIVAYIAAGTILATLPNFINMAEVSMFGKGYDGGMLMPNGKGFSFEAMKGAKDVAVYGISSAYENSIFSSGKFVEQFKLTESYYAFLSILRLLQVIGFFTIGEAVMNCAKIGTQQFRGGGKILVQMLAGIALINIITVANWTYNTIFAGS